MNHSTRVNYLTFVSVAVGLFAGFVVALLAARAAQDADGATGIVGVVVTPLPATVAAAMWALVNRWEPGRKAWGVVAVFFGSFAGLVLLLPYGLGGLVAAMAVAGGFGVAARRLLDRPGDAL